MKKGEVYYHLGNYGTDRLYRISDLLVSNRWCKVQFFNFRKNYIVHFGTGTVSVLSLKETTRKINRRFWYKAIRYLNENRRDIFN